MMTGIRIELSRSGIEQEKLDEIRNAAEAAAADLAEKKEAFNGWVRWPYSMPDKLLDKLEQEARRPFFESRAGKSALDSIFDTLDDASRTMSAAVEEISADPIYPEGYIRAFRYDLDTVNALLDAARDPDSEKMRCLLADYSPLRLPSFKKGTKPERAEELAAIRNGCKKSIGDIQSKFFCFLSYINLYKNFRIICMSTNNSIISIIICFVFG